MPFRQALDFLASLCNDEDGMLFACALLSSPEVQVHCVVFYS